MGICPRSFPWTIPTGHRNLSVKRFLMTFIKVRVMIRVRGRVGVIDLEIGLVRFHVN